MNSLAYLSRQFDVLASAKTPPSTPTDDHPPFTSDRQEMGKDVDPSPQRISTWSAKSFLFLSPGSVSKRPFSSSAFSSLRKLGAATLPTIPTSSDLETQPRSQLHSETIIRRTFFIRVVVLVWDNLRAALLSLWRARNIERPEKARVQDTQGRMVEKTNNKEITPASPVSSLLIPPPVTGRSYADPVQSSDTKLQPSSHNLPQILRSSESPASSSRSSTPILGTRKTPFHSPKTLVLDLDETLIHSTSRPIDSSASGGSGLLGLRSFSSRNKGASHMVEVVLGGRSTLYHVYKRPFVDFFLRTVSGWYTLVIFTASMQEYADPVIDWLDAGRGILGNRLFRDSCTQLPNGSFTKDLSIIEADLSRVCLIDNSPVSYRVNEANGIPIEGWTHDPSDEALLDLLPVLDSLRFTSDVRRVLGLRSAAFNASFES